MKNLLAILTLFVLPFRLRAVRVPVYVSRSRQYPYR